MNIKELKKTFHDAWERAVGYGTVDAEEAGIRAVVEALRDEMSGASRLRDIEKLFNDILGGAADPVGAVKLLGIIEQCKTPAADPAVCEWSVSRDPDGEGHYETRCGNGWMMAVSPPPARDGYNFCPSCGKPIAFKEVP